MKRRASSHRRRARQSLSPQPAGDSGGPIPFFKELSGARGVRAPLDTFLAGLGQTVPFERASFFVLLPGGDLQWAANFWRTQPGEENVVGLSEKLIDWAMADQRPKVAPPGAMGDRRVYLFLPLWGLGQPLGLIILRTLLEAESVGLAVISAAEGMAGWFGERIAYAAAYLGAEAERMRLAGQAALTGELLESVREGLLAVDGGGRVLFINRNARMLLGLFDDGLRGQPLAGMIAGRLGEVLADLAGEARANGHALPREIEWEAAGAKLPLELTAAAVPPVGPAAAGGGTSVLLVVSNQAVGRRLARLEEIDRLKTEFISTVSHELKNPLSSVREAVSLLADGAAGEVSEEARKLIDIVNRNVDYLVRLINDLLDMSRLESGRIQLNLSPVDVDNLVGAVAGRFKIEAARKKIDFRVRSGAGRARVEADPDRLEQVLVNLISNAMKFTLEGFVEISSSADAEGVEISVADSGVGIAAEDLPLIFDEFEQVGRRPELSRKGTGLGLAISRKLVELHGGELSARSQPGEGSIFTVRLRRLAEGGG